MANYYSIKDLSEKQNYMIAGWLWRLTREIDEFRNYENLKVIYVALVLRLGLAEHSGKVVRAMIKKQIKDKNLTPRKDIEAEFHPYDFRGKLKENYKEDSSIYDRSAQWNSEEEEYIDIIRAVFAGKKEMFSQLIAWTFLEPEDKKRKTFSLPPLDKDYSEYIAMLPREKCQSNFFGEAFKLTEDEQKLLDCAYMTHAVRELFEVCDDISKIDTLSRSAIYAKFLGITERTVRTMLRSDKKLVSFGIMTKDGQLDSDAADCIYAGDMNVFFADVLKKDEKKELYKLDSFSVKKEQTELALRLLANNSPANILLYGVPGSGKTEYARALVHSTGLQPLFFNNKLEVADRSKDDSSNYENHALSRLNCLLSLKKSNSIIIVDEAESVLSTRMSLFDFFTAGGTSNNKKGTVNTMLENSANKVIWILNYTSPLDESTLRRFTYSIRFKEMSRNILKSIADTKLDTLPMSPGLRSQLVELCGKYHVTCASVDNVVNTVKGMDLSSGSEKAVVKDVEQVLEANSTLLYGKTKMREKVRDSYDLSVLNTETPADEIVDMVLNARDFAEKNGSEDTGIRMLFYGASGTGKTEFARYIAERLEKKIILKRASDILGSYVGQNEENIRTAFEEAESSGDVLLFDEADSFFANREGAHISWERTMVNEFLTQMEEFSGILICTTNLRKIMDPAMQRRFHILTEFKPLTKDGISRLLGKFFPAYTFSIEETDMLSSYDNVTPGDFGALSEKIRFLSENKIGSRFIINELCRIEDEKESAGHRIGFAG